MKKKKEFPIITHIVYDRKTGRIVHKHRSFDIDKRAYKECRPQEVKNLTSTDLFTLSKVTDNDPKNLAVLITRELPEILPKGISGFIVDTKSKKIIEKPKIMLSAEKKELEGDGKDSSIIALKVIDNKGKLLKGFNSTIKVATSRGKLSTKGGVVEIKKGVGKITLTSVNETVDRVKISAQCLKGRCQRAGLDFEFI